MSNIQPVIWVIDDAAIDSFICKTIINNVVKNRVIEMLDNGTSAIEKLLQINCGGKQIMPDYIFLDLYMPGIDGWQTLEEFERLKIFRDKMVHIYVLSSSIWITDLDKSKANPLVEDFILKPMTTERVQTIFHAA